MDIVQSVFKDNHHPSSIAVHCVAGLGRYVFVHMYNIQSSDMMSCSPDLLGHRLINHPGIGGQCARTCLHCLAVCMCVCVLTRLVVGMCLRCVCVCMMR